LGKRGRALWDRVQTEFGISDVGGIEMLFQACAAADRAEQLAEAVAKHGPLLGGRINPAVRAELSTRAFIVNTLQKLGLMLEPVKDIGRPTSPQGWTGR
jgi:hypothetical protein